MTLLQACDIGLACGLHTLKEAVLNIDLHATSIFSYDSLVKEMAELYKELVKYDSDALISDVFPELLSDES